MLISTAETPVLVHDKGELLQFKLVNHSVLDIHAWPPAFQWEHKLGQNRDCTWLQCLGEGVVLSILVLGGTCSPSSLCLHPALIQKPLGLWGWGTHEPVLQT